MFFAMPGCEGSSQTVKQSRPSTGVEDDKENEKNRPQTRKKPDSGALLNQDFELEDTKVEKCAPARETRKQ